MVKVVMNDGAGGELMQEFVQKHIISHFPKVETEVPLDSLDDSAVVDGIVFTIDGHTVNPLFFPGGDIGRIAVSGTVNDISVMGAQPVGIASSVIMEEGLDADVVDRVMESMGGTAEYAGVPIVTGDTKVMGAGDIDKMVISTAAIGRRWDALDRDMEVASSYRKVDSQWCTDSNVRPGDVIMVSGYMGDHGVAIMSYREGYEFESTIQSDVQPVNRMIEKALRTGGVVQMKDPTRGGLANTLNEWAVKSKCQIDIQEADIPIREGVESACELLGIEPLEIGNEGKCVLSVVPEMAEEVLRAIRRTPEGKDAAVIGRAVEGPSRVVLNTEVGGRRILEPPSGDPVPRICRGAGMVGFVPFRAYRPQVGAGVSVGDLVSPPSDEVTDETMLRLGANGRNVVNLTLRADADGRYRGAGKRLRTMIGDGSLIRDEPSFYVYEQNFQYGGAPVRRRAVVGLLKLEEYSVGTVLPHEGVRRRSWEDREANLADTGADLEPILCVCEGGLGDLNPRLEGAERLLYRFTGPDGTEHRLHRVQDAEVCARITEALKGRKVLIADGHHRYEGALAHYRGTGTDGYILCALVPADAEGIVIQPCHRLIDAGDIGETSAIKNLSKLTVMTETDPEGLKRGLGDHAVGLVFRSGRCFFSDPPEPSGGPDAVFAETAIVNGVYKSDEGKSHFTVSHSTEDQIRSVTAKEHDLAVMVDPPSLQELMGAASAGIRMPRKSTRFHPKIWSGLVFRVSEPGSGVR